MRVAIVSHTYVSDDNRGKLQALADQPNLELLVLVPELWVNRDIGQVLRFEKPASAKPRVHTLPIHLPGYGSLFFYSATKVVRALRQFRPDLIHVEQEPWSVAALELCAIARSLGARLSFFTWENLERSLPLPLPLIRRYVLSRADGAIAGNSEARLRLERYGFARSIVVLPQLGIDTGVFRPPDPAGAGSGFVVGYAGRLVAQKGVMLLLEAFARLPEEGRLLIVGTGPLKSQILCRAAQLGVAGRLELCEGVRHLDMWSYFHRMDVLVLPSLTTTTWKEQFGHVLIEAMACGLPVVGSDSGAIPEVIGDAGLIANEGDPESLAASLRQLWSSRPLRARLGAKGRARVLSHYTHAVVAESVTAFWRTLLDE